LGAGAGSGNEQVVPVHWLGSSAERMLSMPLSDAAHRKAERTMEANISKLLGWFLRFRREPFPPLAKTEYQQAKFPSRIF